MELCVALDMPYKEQNLALLRTLEGLDIWVKVGLRSFIRDGKTLLEDIARIDNFRVFLDLKLYDIPNTMGDSVYELASLGVNMVTLHASSGREGMQEARSRLIGFENPPLLMAVTALTSFTELGFGEVYDSDIKTKAVRMAQIAYESGMDGVVCSVHESALLKQATQPSFLTLTPGIRPFGESNDDQKRVADVVMAREALSDFIVVGRPVYQASDPREVCQKIMEQINA